MKLTTASIITATIVIVGSGLHTASAEAATGSTPYVMQVTDYGKNINQPCKGGKNPMYKAVVTVSSDGNFVNGDLGIGILHMQDGTPLGTTDYPVPTTSYLTNEFYWYAMNGAKVDTSAYNFVVVEGPGENMSFEEELKLKVKRLCQGYYQGYFQG